MSLFGRAALMGNTSAAGGADPSTMVGWHAAYWAENLAFANGANVTSWADEIGSEDLTGSGFPTMVTSDASFNNHKSVQFGPTDTNRHLTIGNASHPATQAQPFAFVVIFKVDSFTGTGVIVDGAGSFEQRVSLASAGADYVIYAGGTSRVGGTPDTTNAHCALAYFNGASSRLEIDGTSVISGASPGGDSHDGMRLGYHSSGSTTTWRFDGRIAFAGVYYGDPESDGGWATFKTWVGTYYGISVA